MRSKLSWIIAIPFTLAAIFLKLAQTLLPDGAILGLSDLMLDYAVLGCVAVIFLFSLIFCLIDKKISPYYIPHHNVPAGIIGILLALALAADGADMAYDLFAIGGGVEIMAVAEAVLLMLAAIIFVVMGLTHSFRGTKGKGMSILSVMPALLFAVRLVRCFIGFTTISITQADVVLLIAYVFATMFFFNYAVTLSLTRAKNAVKSCFIFGFPAIAAVLAFGVEQVVFHFDTADLFSNTVAVELLLTGLYIFAFLMEMTLFIKDRDHVQIDDEDEEEYKDVHEDEEDPSANDYVVTGVDDEERMDVPNSSYLTTADTSDFLYVDTSGGEEEKKAADNASGHDVDDYITEIVDSKYDEKEKKNPNSYTDRLDEIDKLILQISGDTEE